MCNTRRANVRAKWQAIEKSRSSSTIIFHQSDMPLSEQPNYQLPYKMKAEQIHGLSMAEIDEKIEYFKERSTYYLRAFNASAIEAERVHFQNCCEYHTTKLLVWEVEKEKLSL
jgi:hypothetical protein